MNPPNALPPQLLKVTGLTLSRGGRTLFDGYDLRLGAAETLFVRGPNGAGKSSLLLALASILSPQAGRIDWLEPEETPQIHFLGHQNGIKPRLTLAENLRFWRTVNGPSGIEVEPALARVGLGGLGGIVAEHLSSGQTRRLALARLLVTKRKIWLLDEPTAALDATGRGLVSALLLEHNASRGGAIVATHDDIPHMAAARIVALDPG